MPTNENPRSTKNITVETYEVESAREANARSVTTHAGSQWEWHRLAVFLAIAIALVIAAVLGEKYL